MRTTRHQASGSETLKQTSTETERGREKGNNEKSRRILKRSVRECRIMRARVLLARLDDGKDDDVDWHREQPAIQSVCSLHLNEQTHSLTAAKCAPMCG